MHATTLIGRVAPLRLLVLLLETVCAPESKRSWFGRKFTEARAQGRVRLVEQVIATGFDSSVGLLTLTRIAGASADAQFTVRAEENVKVEGGESRRCARLRPFDTGIIALIT